MVARWCHFLFALFFNDFAREKVWLLFPDARAREGRLLCVARPFLALLLFSWWPAGFDGGSRDARRRRLQSLAASGKACALALPQGVLDPSHGSSLAGAPLVRYQAPRFCHPARRRGGAGRVAPPRGIHLAVERLSQRLQRGAHPQAGGADRRCHSRAEGWRVERYLGWGCRRDVGARRGRSICERQGGSVGGSSVGSAVGRRLGGRCQYFGPPCGEQPEQRRLECRQVRQPALGGGRVPGFGNHVRLHPPAARAH
mmetsp:Transcript_1396/g.4466  ORF Transcript_1396/g.4466 Transcript_1396/m.4466 type:complete len:256 (+) Transcript_1396:311-1078(+)